MTDTALPRNGDPTREHDPEAADVAIPPDADEGPTCGDSVGPRSWEEAKRRGLDVSLGMKPEDFRT